MSTSIHLTVTEVTTGTNDDTINDTINTHVKDRLIREVKYIYEQGGVTIKMLIDIFELTRITAKRGIGLLKAAGIVEFKGSNKSGKYLLTDKGTDLFDKSKP